MDAQFDNGQTRQQQDDGRQPPVQESARGVGGRQVRAIFASTAPEPQREAAGFAPAPQTAAAGAPSLVIIRNCSTKQVLDSLLAELGGSADVSGRYFAPAVQDVARIKQVAASHELFMKESRIRDVVVLDLMVDRTIHPFQPAHRHPAPRRRFFDRGAN